MSDAQRLLITGSRDWTDKRTVTREMYRWWEEAGLPVDVTVVHGGARGADTIAAEVAREVGFKVEEHAADWDRWGKRAGYIRNAEMVNTRPDACLAFILNGSKGATMCAALASNAQIPTRVVARPKDAVESSPVVRV